MTVRGNSGVLRTLWGGGRGWILVVVAFGWFLSYGVRMVYPAILPQLRLDFGFDLTTAGLLITALWAATALGQLPGGMLDDRYGSARVLVVSTVASAAALTVAVTAWSVSGLFVGTVLLGFATALYSVGRFTIVATHFRDQSGVAIGIVMAAGDLGNSVLPPVAGIVTVVLAWEVGLGVAIPFFLLAAGAIVLTVPRATPSDGADAPGGMVVAFHGVVAAMRDRSMLLVVVVQTIAYCVWQSFTAFYPLYLVVMKDVSPSVAAVLFGGFFATGIVIKPVTGRLYDARGIRSSLPVVLGVMAVSLALLPFAFGLPALVGVTVLASSLLGFAAITHAYFTEALPAAIQGTGIGVIRTGFVLIGAGTPTLMGVLADAGWFDEAFFVLALASFAGGVLAVFVTDPARVD